MRASMGKPRRNVFAAGWRKAWEFLGSANRTHPRNERTKSRIVAKAVEIRKIGERRQERIVAFGRPVQGLERRIRLAGCGAQERDVGRARDKDHALILEEIGTHRAEALDAIFLERCAQYAKCRGVQALQLHAFE